MIIIVESQNFKCYKVETVSPSASKFETFVLFLKLVLEQEQFEPPIGFLVF